MRNEIHWNQQKMAEELNKVAEKIKALEYALHDKLDPTRLVETRLENRSLRYFIEIKKYMQEEYLIYSFTDQDRK